MKLEEMTAVELLASKKIERLYGEPLWVAMIENKNDLHTRSYNGRKLKTISRLLFDKLSEYEKNKFYVRFKISSSHLFPNSISELTEIYSYFYNLEKFSERELNSYWEASRFLEFNEDISRWARKTVEGLFGSSRINPQ
jgi:hypothetical protein